MSKSDVYARLKAAGIKRGSRSYRDYEKAKQLLLGDWVPQSEWATIHQAIIEYVGI